MRNRYRPGNSWFVVDDQDQIAMLLQAAEQIMIGEPADDKLVLGHLRDTRESGEAYFLWAINPKGHEIWAAMDDNRFFQNLEGIFRVVESHLSQIKGLWKIRAEVLHYAEALCEHRAHLAA
ncbi:hypothetical protein HYV21_01415 [Candidatus Microgenomates bacterium]|nr:hypothetical protein [Candidatus Microgenomates bacterium]